MAAPAVGPDLGDAMRLGARTAVRGDGHRPHTVLRPDDERRAGECNACDRRIGNAREDPRRAGRAARTGNDVDGFVVCADVEIARGRDRELAGARNVRHDVDDEARRNGRERSGVRVARGGAGRNHGRDASKDPGRPSHRPNRTQAAVERFGGSVMPGGQASCVALPIGDYAMIGDRQSAALVGNDGSIDWFCAPRFDSPACFAALVGTADNGRWLVAPADPIVATQRRYVGDTMTLETTFACASGTVVLTDVMVEGGAPRIVRTIRCVAGRVAMRMELIIRFDYGSVVPWVRRTDGGLVAVGGPDGLRLASDVALEPRGLTTVAAFTLVAAESAGFELASFRSYEALPAARAPEARSRGRRRTGTRGAPTASMRATTGRSSCARSSRSTP